MSERDDDHEEDEIDTELDPADDEVDTEAPDAGEDDDLDIGFDGEQEEQNGGDLVRHLRAKLNETQAELAKRGPAEPTIDPGPMPTMDDEDVEWDGAKLAAKMEKWVEDKARAKAQTEAAETAANQSGVAIATDLAAGVTRLKEGRTTLNRPDFDISETAVTSTLNDMQMSAILILADDPAKLIYALGRSPSKMKELAAITNPFKFSAAIHELKGKVTMKPKKTGVEPDEPIRGSARMSKGVDKQRAKLEEEADRTGDRSKLAKYNRDQKEAARRR